MGAASATLILWVAVIAFGAPLAVFPILTSNARISMQQGGFYLLPTNQLLRPWGEQSAIKGRPVGPVGGRECEFVWYPSETLATGTCQHSRSIMEDVR